MRSVLLASVFAFGCSVASAGTPPDLETYWKVVKHTTGQPGAERLVSCGPSPLDRDRCYMLGGADPWRWIERYREKGEGFEASLPIMLPGDIGSPAFVYVPVKVVDRDTTIALPPLSFVSIENRDAFAECWEAGRCEIAYGGACEAGMTKAGDEHFAQPVMPYFFVREWDGVTTLYVNVYYAATKAPTAEGFARADAYLHGLLAMSPADAAAVAIDRPRTALVPADVFQQFSTMQRQIPQTRVE